MTMSSTFKSSKFLLVPAIAAGLTLGGLNVSKAQSVLFTNNDGIAAGGASTVVPATGSSITRPFVTGDSYFINSAGTADNSVKDAGQGIGADIRLTLAGNGVRLISNQNGTLNTASDVYTFYTTLTDQASGQSGILTSTFTFNTSFNEGNSTTGVSNVSFGSLKGGVLGGNLLVLGNNVYSASNFSFTPPSAPPQTGGTSFTDGAFAEHISATPTNNTPEPGAVAMMIGMGIGGTTLLIRRKRK